MSALVPVEDIERIVGAKRHATEHLARAASAEQTVYILHSHHCLTESRRYGRDLRDCKFSLALDNGIRISEWQEDVPVPVRIEGAYEDTRLVPCAPSQESTPTEAVNHVH